MLNWLEARRRAGEAYYQIYKEDDAIFCVGAVTRIYLTIPKEDSNCRTVAMLSQQTQFHSGDLAHLWSLYLGPLSANLNIKVCLPGLSI